MPESTEGVNIALMLLLSKSNVFRRWYLVIPVFAISIVISLRTGIWLLRLSSVVYYVVIAAFMLLELFISEFNYDWIIPGTTWSCALLAEESVDRWRTSTMEISTPVMRVGCLEKWEIRSSV